MITQGMTTSFLFDFPLPWAIRDVLEQYEDMVFLGGGSVRRMVLGEDTTGMDFDLWPIEARFAEGICNRLEKHGYTKALDTAYAASFTKENEFPVQVIKHTYFDSPLKFFEYVDFTIAQWASNGKGYVVTTQGLDDSRNKVLRIVNPQSPMGTLRRIAKFAAQGFTITYEQAHAFCSALVYEPGLLAAEQNQLKNGGGDSTVAA